MALPDLIPFPQYFSPAVLLTTAVYHFFMTILETVFLEFRPFALFNVTALRFKSFARLWTYNGAAMSEEMPGNTDSLLRSCSGIILDLGPGSGEQLSRFDPSKISALYGAEPAVELHKGLLRNAEKAGFTGEKYKAMQCGAEPECLIPALAKTGILKAKQGSGEGVFDEIVCCRVLCGVPRPQETINSLYALLKPGGRFVVCEHIKNPWRSKGSFLGRTLQLVYTLAGWPFFMGGCELQRDTPQYLKEAAGGEGWQSDTLEYVDAHAAIPWIIGELRKKGRDYAQVVKDN